MLRNRMDRRNINIIMAVVMSVCMLIVLSGCGSGGQKDNNTEQARGSGSGRRIAKDAKPAKDIASEQLENTSDESEDNNKPKGVVKKEVEKSNDGRMSSDSDKKNDSEHDDTAASISFDKKTNELLLYTEALDNKSGSNAEQGINAGEIKQIAEVKRGDYSHRMNALGEVYYLDKYYEMVDIDNATFKSYKVEVGDYVKKGDVIYTYDVEVDEAEIKQKEAELEQSEKDYIAGYDSRKAEINRAEHELKSLKDKNEIQIKKLEIKKLKQALKEYAGTKKDIDKNKSELNKYMSGVNSTKITASHDGYILSLAEIKKDDPLTKGNIIAVISPKKDCCIRVDDVSEGKLRYNSEVEVIVEGGKGQEEKTYKGKVIGSSNVLSSDNAKEYAYVKVENASDDVDWDNAIKISYTAKELKDVLIVPKAAVYYEETGEGRNIVKQSYVYEYENEHTFKRYVEVYNDGGEECVIIQGVVEGQQLAVY